MLQRLWNLLCSLKLAIVLASAAAVATMGGSLLIPGRPAVFGSLDRMPLGEWLFSVGSRSPGLSWWIFLVAALILLLGLNTLCCFIDWLAHFSARWRKTGEYLIHLGFVLIVTAYAWGSLAGFRSEGNRLLVGQTLPLPPLPGHYLRLENFEPVFNDEGRLLDMISRVVLLRGEEALARQEVRINTPLTYRDLVVVPVSFGRVAEGFRFFLPGQGPVLLTPGSSLAGPDGTRLRIMEFFPNARRRSDGRVLPLGQELENPALLLELTGPDGPWQGWYFLREALPRPLREAGLILRPVAPLFRPYSIFTVNQDPGAFLALAGALAMTCGVLLALFSFYAKRTRRDRPEIP